MISLNIGRVDGLTDEEQSKLYELVEAFNYHQSANQKKQKYYEGNIRLHDVNLGIALPKGFRNLEIGCEWGAKTVDVLASRSMFDGFVSSSGRNSDTVHSIMEANNFYAEYEKACRDELKFGCDFVTLSRDPETHCKIRLHSPMSASALWSGEKGRIDAGLAIVDSAKDEAFNNEWIPTLINMYTDDAIYVLRRIKDRWHSEKHSHKMGRPLMVPLIYNATSQKPFGRSRIKEPVRRLIDGYVRTLANATIGLEFATSPQKYIMGVTDDQYDAITGDKFKQYVGSIIAGTVNPETGTAPSFGQLTQGNIQPHVEMIRILATQFSAATGLSVTDTGVVNDANPTSSDAILAQSQTLILMAEQLNRSNGHALKTIAQMAQAIARDCSMDDLTEEEMDVIPHFKNPSMPSIASTADAATKIASIRPEFAQTDVFLEMVGMDQADIRRIKTQEQRARGAIVLANEFAEVNANDDIDTGLA